MFIEAIVDPVLFFVCIFIILGSIYVTIRTRFIQITFFPALYRMIRQSMRNRGQGKEGTHTVMPYKALFTAMSTTLGIGTIVGPVIAIHVGGPGALLGFLLTAFLGSAATYTEVNLCIQHRQKLPDGSILGGPMQYLKKILSPFAAKWYAVCGSILMAAWSAAQANQLAAILDSPLLGDYRIPTMLSGVVIAALVIMTLIGGIKRISSFSAKLVPAMFLLYLGSCLWILGINYDRIWDVLTVVVQSAFQPYAMATGTVVGGVVSALRWGVFKGTQVTEAGVGTQTIPHSMAETNDPVAQGILAMASTYTAGVVSFISGCVALMTGTWEDPTLPLGISMVAASFKIYFSYFGIIITAVSAILFAFGTILGNSYNGSQCFNYIGSQKKIKYYYLITAVMIFLGSIGGVKVVWSVIDLGLACLVVPHMAALMLHVSRQPSKLTEEESVPELTSAKS
jgi:AGCS family alanine or glycine:cation symporter